MYRSTMGEELYIEYVVVAGIREEEKSFLPYVLISSRGRFHHHMPDGMLPESVRVFFFFLLFLSSLP